MSSLLIAWAMARRTLGLSKGGCAQFIQRFWLKFWTNSWRHDVRRLGIDQLADWA